MTIEALASGIQGTVNSLTCPECNGGVHNDKSLSITVEHGLIKWICYRASCNYRGIRHDNPNNTTRMSVKDAKPVYDKPHRTLTHHEEDYLKEKYGLRDHELAGVRKSNNYFAFPVRNIMGKQVGWSHKKDVGNGPKSLTYGPQDMIHYADPDDGRTVVIVESWLDATKVSRYKPCVALLGTNLNYAQVIDIASWYDRAVFMLDMDAWGKAAKLCSKYSLLFREGCGYATWECGLDPKDMQIENLEQVIIDNVGG